MKNFFFKAKINFLTLGIIVLFMSSCMKPLETLTDVKDFFLSNNGVFCKTPGVNFLYMNLTGKCRITGTSKNNNWGIVPSVVLQTAKANTPDISISPVCYRKETPRGVPSSFECPSANRKIFISFPAHSFSLVMGNTTSSIVKGAGEEFAFNSFDSIERSYELSAYCDRNNNNLFDNGDTLFQNVDEGSQTLNLLYEPNEDDTKAGTISFDQTGSIPVLSLGECHPTEAEQIAAEEAARRAAEEAARRAAEENAKRTAEEAARRAAEAAAAAAEAARIAALRAATIQNAPQGDPLVIDLFNDGFKYERTLQEFDYVPGGDLEKWYGIRADNNDDAFLVLDINGDGKINNGSELFGNYTSFYLIPTEETLAKCKNGQKVSNPLFHKKAWEALPKHGFEALMIYDKLENCGNADGWIDAKDLIYPYLKLWLQKLDEQSNNQFINKNLIPISEFGMSIRLAHSLLIQEDPLTGNQERYRSIVKMTNSPMTLGDARTGEELKVYETSIVDVFFCVLNPNNNSEQPCGKDGSGHY